jgi:hypothetical protein
MSTLKEAIAEVTAAWRKSAAELERSSSNKTKGVAKIYHSFADAIDGVLATHVERKTEPAPAGNPVTAYLPFKPNILVDLSVNSELLLTVSDEEFLDACRVVEKATAELVRLRDLRIIRRG